MKSCLVNSASNALSKSLNKLINQYLIIGLFCFSLLQYKQTFKMFYCSGCVCLYMMYMCEWTFVCHGVYVAIKGQLSGVGFVSRCFEAGFLPCCILQASCSTSFQAVLSRNGSVGIIDAHHYIRCFTWLQAWGSGCQPCAARVLTC